MGYGMIACDGHIPAYRIFNDKVDLCGICGPDKMKCTKVAEMYNIPGSYSSFDDMLADCRLDLVSICTPNLSHAEYVEKALDAGVNILCEKPVSLSYSEASRLYQLAQAKGLLLEACQTIRFNPSYFAVKDLVQSGYLGNMIFGDCFCTRRRGAPIRGSFLSAAKNGGGAFADIGVHFIDAILWMMNASHVKSVSGTLSSAIIHHESDYSYNAVESGSYGFYDAGSISSADECDVEDFASGMIRLENNVGINFCIAWNSNIIPQRRMTILGDRRGIQLPELMLFEEGGKSENDRKIDTGRYDFSCDLPFPGHYHLIKNALAYLDGAEEVLVQPRETLNTTAVLDLFYRSCKEGREVFFSELAEKSEKQQLNFCT